MKLKLDDKGNVVLLDGKPVYVHDDGKEIAFDAPGAIAKIGQLNGEAKSHRERAETAEEKLKAFDGIENAAAARKALDTVKNLDDKKLVDAGEVEKIKTEAIKSVRAEFEPVVKERDRLKTDLYSEKIGGAFARSKFIAEKVAIPADMVQAAFGSRFKVENGKTVAMDSNGQPIFSRTRHGDPADFEEALEIMIDQYPNKAQILKSSGASGSGASNAGGNVQGGKKTYTREQFNKLDPATQRTVSLEAAKGSAVIAD